MESRIYTIKDSPYYFRAGQLPLDGKQFLVGRLSGDVIGLVFNSNGELLEQRTRPLTNPASNEAALAEIEEWMAQFGASPSHIRVRMFSIPELSIFIEDLPGYLQEYVDSPESFPEDRQRHLARCVSDWRQRGSFVLNWVEEYEMSQDGDVEST